MQSAEHHIDHINSLTGPSLTSLTRHPELWFDDGSVILVAEAMSFRVHSSILCKHSSVLSDILSIPQTPDNGSETIEGCPVIRMHDSAHELAQLLKACYDPYFPQETLADAVSLDYALSILRLSTKYHMPTFRRRSLDELKKYFPSDSLSSVVGYKCKYWHEVSSPNLALIRAVSIARESGAFELLPVVFARLCNVSLEEAFVVDASTFLEREDLQRLAIGREQLRFVGEDAFIHAARVSAGCTNPGGCKRGMTFLAESARFTLRILPFFLVCEYRFGKSESKLCLPCWTKTDIAQKNAHEVVWNSLPEFFGLGSWQDLKRASVDMA